jgi:virulence factor Mce-like protein
MSGPLPNRGPSVNPAIVGLVAAAAMFGLLLFAFTNVTLFQPKQVVKAEVASADTLANSADVEVAGVKIGTVKSITSGSNGGAVVTMEINNQKTSIYKDATAQIRPHGVFGPKFVQLGPGSESSGKFPDGGTIDQANTSVSVDFEQVLNQLDDNTRQSLQTFFYEFGTWQENRGADQAAVIDNLNVLTAQLTPPLQVIANRKTEFGRFTDNNAIATETLAESQIAQIIHDNNTLLTALDQHQAGLVAVITHGNNVFNDLDQITSGNNVENLRATLPKLPVLLDNLTRFSNDLGTGLNHASPVFVPARGQQQSDIGLAILRTRDAFGECDVSDDSSADTVHANNVKITPCFGADGKRYVDPATGHVAHHHVKVLLGLHTNGTPGTSNEDESAVLCGPHTTNAARGANPAFTCTSDPVQTPASSIPPAGGPAPPPFGASSSANNPAAAPAGTILVPLDPAGLLDILAGG